MRALVTCCTALTCCPFKSYESQKIQSYQRFIYQFLRFLFFSERNFLPLTSYLLPRTSSFLPFFLSSSQQLAPQRSTARASTVALGIRGKGCTQLSLFKRGSCSCRPARLCGPSPSLVFPFVACGCVTPPLPGWATFACSLWKGSADVLLHYHSVMTVLE